MVISGAPDLVEGKMLEVEEILDGTARTLCDTTLAVLTACRATDSVKALLFDTTASYKYTNFSNFMGRIK